MNEMYQRHNNLKSKWLGCLVEPVFSLLITLRKNSKIPLVSLMLWEIFRNFEPILGSIITTKDLQIEYCQQYILFEFLRLKKGIFWEKMNIAIQKGMHVQSKYLIKLRALLRCIFSYSTPSGCLWFGQKFIFVCIC